MGSWWWCEGGRVRFLFQSFACSISNLDSASVSAENSKRLFKHSKYSKAVGPGTHKERKSKVLGSQKLARCTRSLFGKRLVCAKGLFLQIITCCKRLPDAKEFFLAKRILWEKLLEDCGRRRIPHVNKLRRASFPTICGGLPIICGVLPTICGGLPTICGGLPTICGGLPSICGGLPTIGGGVLIMTT